MKFALVNDQRVEAFPKQKGVCPLCGNEVISKCGKVMTWHWSHKGAKTCDSWWENETDWHRQWKAQFPTEWQEIIHVDTISQERHIADVKTPHGLVIEFQHSPLSLEEIAARENFYGNMIWIVDGLRNPSDQGNFSVGLGEEISSNPVAYPIRWWSKSKLLHHWSQAKVKVLIDFGEDHLWRLIFFDNAKKQGAVGPMEKVALIQDCLAGSKQFRLYFRDLKDESPVV